MKTMSLKEKTKTYSFWMSLISSLLLVAKTICEQCGVVISDAVTTNIITGVCSVMVLAGLFISPTKKMSLKELQTEAEQIMNNQEQTYKQIKEEVESAMDMQEKLSIEEQIEFLKHKLEEANQEPEHKEEVQEQQAQSEPEIVVAEQEVEDEQPKVVVEDRVETSELKEEAKEEPHEEEASELKEMGLVELKQVVLELLKRI